MHARPSSLRTFLHTHRLELGYTLLLLLMAAVRGYWAPDEPDFAQCVKEMRWQGAWLLPSLNGLPYDEKPILFYWLMKLGALIGERLTGGLGFLHGIAPWALRLPSVAASVLFLIGFRRWSARFVSERSASTATLILATTPLWLWQSQFIQIDLVFSALLAWSWLSWYAGYLLVRGHVPMRDPRDACRWFFASRLCLALAFLAKGPLALVLSLALLLAFLAWQRDFRVLREIRIAWGAVVFFAIALPWYIAAWLKGGPTYLYALVVHQNVERALSAWDHIQPWWRYLTYLAADFFPWTLVLPWALWAVWKRVRSERKTVLRGLLLAFLVPLVLLSLSRSKQGKYLLMAYPFLALLVAEGVHTLAEAAPRRALNRMLGLGLALPALVLLALAWFHAGGAKTQAQLAPLLAPLRLGSVLLVAGVAVLLAKARHDLLRQVRVVGGTFLACYLGIGAWGFARLDALKDFKGWQAQVEETAPGCRLWFWGPIRSGVMVYSDRLVPEVTTREALLTLGPEDRLVVMQRRWAPGFQGLRPEDLKAFEVVFQRSQGSDMWTLLRRKVTPGRS